MGDDARKLLAELCVEFNGARVRAGMTTAEVAAAAGVTSHLVEAVESGQHRELGDCAAIAAVLGQRLAIVQAPRTHTPALPVGVEDAADDSAGANVVQLNARGRRGGAETAHDDFPGVW